MITLGQAERAGKRLGVKFNRFSVQDFRKGMNVELEHRDVTKGNLTLTGKIALAHLKERPDYYERLEVVEKASRKKLKRCM
jgi:hypothetical protein